MTRSMAIGMTCFEMVVDGSSCSFSIVCSSCFGSLFTNKSCLQSISLSLSPLISLLSFYLGWMDVGVRAERKVG